MKKLPLLFVWVLVDILSSCTTKPEPPYTALTFIVDVSAAEFYNPQFLDENLPIFYQLMDLDPETGGLAGGKITFSIISGSGDAISEHAYLKKGRAGENRLIRQDEIEDFKNECMAKFSKLLEVSWETDKSRILEKTSRALNDLKAVVADTKYLILYSDLIENSNYINLYDDEVDLPGLIADPENTLTKFAVHGPVIPEDLQGIEIIAITNRNNQNTELVTQAEALWTSLITHRGGKIRFASTLEY